MTKIITVIIPTYNRKLNFNLISKFYKFKKKIELIIVDDGSNQLIESFKATLEEINESDYIINVVDINDINFQSKINITKKILKETGVSSHKIKNMITVFNKIDLQKKTFKNSNVKSYVSALNGDGLDQLKKQMTSII